MQHDGDEHIFFEQFQHRLRRFQHLEKAQLLLNALEQEGIGSYPELLSLLQQPSQRELDLGQGSRLEIRQAEYLLPPIAFCPGKQVLLVLIGSQAITFFLSEHMPQGEAAWQAGQVLAQQETSPLPFSVYLIIAYLAIIQNIPRPLQIQLMYDMARPADGRILVAKEALPLRALRQIVREAFASKEETIPLPKGLWNTACGLILTGEGAWHFPRVQAAHWGSFPTYTRSAADHNAWHQRIQLAALAGIVASPSILAKLPIPPAQGAVPEEVWVDYISLAGGTGKPDPLLRSTGLGFFATSKLENNPDPDRLALSKEHAEALSAIAAAVLADLGDRPPRYIGRVLELDMPHHLLPQLGAWDIESLVIQPEFDGLYLSVRNTAKRSMAAAWWKAEKESVLRTPLAFTPAAWAVLHPICASIFRDLKAEAIVIEKPNLLSEGQSAVPGKKRKKSHHSKKHQRVYLPPVRVIATAKWGSEGERKTLQKVTAQGHGYRRLPQGWMEREEEARLIEQETGKKPEILHRREEAARRAEEHASPPPPPGWTYVAPYFRGGRQTGLSPDSVPIVRAKGLFSLILGLQVNAIQPLQIDGEDAQSHTFRE